MSAEIPCLVGNGACPTDCPAFEIAKTVFEELSAGKKSPQEMGGIFGSATPPGQERSAVDLAMELCIKETSTTPGELY